MPDCRFEEYFLPDTLDITFGDDTIRNLLDAFKVHGPWQGISGELAGPNPLPGEHILAEFRLYLMTFALLSQLMSTTEPKTVPGIPIHVGYRTR